MRKIEFDHPYHGAISEQFTTKRIALKWALDQEHANDCTDMRCDITNMINNGYVNAAAMALFGATDELHFLTAVCDKFGYVSRKIADKEQSEWWEYVKPSSRRCGACNAISHGDEDNVPESCVSCGSETLTEIDRTNRS